MDKKNVLIIGSGGREHALGWKLRQSPKVDKIYFAPGNAGTAEIGTNTGIAAMDFEAQIKFAWENNVFLTVAGPDDILAAGAVNEFQNAGLKIFGATKEAAHIEFSKAFAKDLMKAEGIPTAKYETFRDVEKAKAYVKEHGSPLVIKASGLALGKGVVVAYTLKEALLAVEDAMVNKIFGDAGSEVVIEEYLEGPEVSIHVFSDGENIAIFPTSRDHKAIFDGNKGPNTGGMGTIAPLPEITAEQLEEIKNKIVIPAIRGMKTRGTPFTGCLYPGLMMTTEGPKVIEFNSRFGDPEFESYMRLLKTDVFDILVACTERKLNEVPIEWSDQSACCIILATHGYPESSEKGIPVHGLETVKNDDKIVVFHLSTKMDESLVVTNGGRVVGITATGNNLDEALDKAYSVIGEKGIHFERMQYRKDIGRVKF
jgi:phosphoribosylamine--glycine ligase